MLSVSYALHGNCLYALPLSCVACQFDVLLPLGELCGGHSLILVHILLYFPSIALFVAPHMVVVWGKTQGLTMDEPCRRGDDSTHLGASFSCAILFM